MELSITTLVIGVCLLLHIVRPYIKAFRKAQGFVFFPFVALICCALSVLAYGLRIELFPLYLFTLVYTLTTLPRMVSVVSGLREYGFRRNMLPLSILAFAFFAAAVFIAFRFLPLENEPYSKADWTQFKIPEGWWKF